VSAISAATYARFQHQTLISIGKAYTFDNLLTEETAVARSNLNINLEGGGTTDNGDLALLFAAGLESLSDHIDTHPKPLQVGADDRGVSKSRRHQTKRAAPVLSGAAFVARWIRLPF